MARNNASVLNMEALSRQAGSFRHSGQGLPPVELLAGFAHATVGCARQVECDVEPAGGVVQTGGGMLDAGSGPAALSAEVAKLHLRIAAEQQCVLREQHIVARMWIEKSRAEEAAEAADVHSAELEATVAGWEAWHRSQRRQQRQRRQRGVSGALRAAPAELLGGLFIEWGVPSVSELKREERHVLAATLEAAAAALRQAAPPRPHGL